MLLQAVNGYPMEPSPQAVAAVEYALRRLCNWLVHGENLPPPLCALPSQVSSCQCLTCCFPIDSLPHLRCCILARSCSTWACALSALAMPCYNQRHGVSETARDVQAIPVPSTQTWKPLRWDPQRSSSLPGERPRRGI